MFRKKLLMILSTFQGSENNRVKRIILPITGGTIRYGTSSLQFDLDILPKGNINLSGQSLSNITIDLYSYYTETGNAWQGSTQLSLAHLLYATGSLIKNGTITLNHTYNLSSVLNRLCIGNADLNTSLNIYGKLVGDISGRTDLDTNINVLGYLSGQMTGGAGLGINLDMLASELGVSVEVLKSILFNLNIQQQHSSTLNIVQNKLFHLDIEQLKLNELNM